MSKTAREPSLQAVLSSIQRHVLHDVWISRRRVIGAAVLGCGLGATAAAGAPDAFRNDHWLAVVANVLFLALAATTLVGLYRRRFAWCCAATCFGGLATVAGLGAFWWYRTAQVETNPAVVTLCGAAAVVLTAHWLAVVTAPIEHSQPDMRMAHNG